ncbi:MAG TPA: nicotinamide riboside transporter PnuC [Chitinophagaceae bacterium]
MIEQVYEQLIENLKQTGILEFIAVITGIASVWFSKKENILVYPVGLVNTTIYIYLSFKYHLLGEATVNFYYTVMSIYGWILWSKRNESHEHLIHISFSTTKQWVNQLSFFAFFYVTIYFALTYLKGVFAEGAIPWGDAFASATAFTGMWLMAKKKVESWYWWIATNIASIPLYFVKGLAFTSIYYLVLLVLAFFGLAEWKRKASRPKPDAEV